MRLRRRRRGLESREALRTSDKWEKDLIPLSFKTGKSSRKLSEILVEKVWQWKLCGKNATEDRVGEIYMQFLSFKLHWKRSNWAMG